MNETIIYGIRIQYDAGNVRIVDSLAVKKRHEMEMILNLFLIETGYRTRRSMKSWIWEWKAHNRLYKLGLFRHHTKDCDLEELEKRSRRIVYFLMGGII